MIVNIKNFSRGFESRDAFNIRGRRGRFASVAKDICYNLLFKFSTLIFVVALRVSFTGRNNVHEQSCRLNGCIFGFCSTAQGWFTFTSETNFILVNHDIVWFLDL